MMAQLFSINDPMTASEGRMLTHLQSSLPSDWVVFGNPRIVKGYSAQEVDALVVGDKGIWVLDDKNLDGEIRCTMLSWTLANGHTRKNPLESLENACTKIKGMLQAHLPHTDHLWVRGLIILPNATVLKVESEELEKWVKSRVVSQKDCVRRLLAGSGGSPLNAATRAEIVRCLTDPQINIRINNQFTRIASYEILERLSQTGAVRTFRARRVRTDKEVELKVYDLSHLPDRKTKHDLRRQAERESEALRRLMDTTGIVRIEESFQDVEGYGGELYYTAISLPAGPSLATSLGQQSWPYTSRLVAAKRLCEIIGAVHAQKIVHRNLSPACIHFNHDGADFQLTGFEFARVAQLSTLHIGVEDLQPGAYAAPEVTASPSNATEASDIYSLGAILFHLLSGHPAFGERTRQAGDPDPVLPRGGELPPHMLRQLDGLLQSMLAFEPVNRPVDLTEAGRRLGELIAVRQSQERPTRRPDDQYEVGEQIGDYRVLQYLGSGGCFHVYKVGKHVDDNEPRVAKVSKDHALLGLAGLAFACLRIFSHQNVPRAYEVSERPEAPYHLLEEFVPGETASKLIARGPVPAAQVATWAYALSDALAKMESFHIPLSHGDISANNIMVDGDRVCLIDFGQSLVDGFKEGSTLIGTPRYTPPERQVHGVAWPPSGDVYSLGIVLCEMIFGTLPYLTEKGAYYKNRLREDLFNATPGASRQLLATLRRAIAHRPEERFENARAFRAALAAVPELAGEVTVETEELTVIVETTETTDLTNPPVPPPEEETVKIIPLGAKVNVQRAAHGSKVPPGYQYVGQLDDLPGEHFYRERDSHLALVFPGSSGVPSFLIDNYAVTARQFSDFLNDLAARGLLLAVDDQESRGTKARDLFGRVLVRDAFSDWSRGGYGSAQTNGGQPWGLTYQDDKWQPINGFDLLPAVMVTWWGARLYSLWAHRRLERLNEASLTYLPLATQWQAAAFYDPVRGRLLRYPWGETWNRELVNYAGYWAQQEIAVEDDLRRWEKSQQRESAQVHPLPVATLSEGRSPIGCVQMLGNVWEWCADAGAPSPANTHENLTWRLIKGGACNSPHEQCKIGSARSWRADNGNRFIGFRCAITL